MSCLGAQREEGRAVQKIAVHGETGNITSGHLPRSRHVKILIFELLTSNGLWKNV